MDRSGQSRSPIGGRRSLAEYAHSNNSNSSSIRSAVVIRNRSPSPEIEVPVSSSVRKRQAASESHHSTVSLSTSASVNRSEGVSQRSGGSAERKGTSGSTSWTDTFSSRLGQAVRNKSMPSRSNYKPVAVGGGGGNSKMDISSSRREEDVSRTSDNDEYYPPSHVVKCPGVKIWFGSYAAATNGDVFFGWKMDGSEQWKLTFSSLDSADNITLRQGDVAEIHACLSVGRPVVVILTTPACCASISHQLDLRREDLNVFDVKSERSAHKLVCLDFGDCSNKMDFIRTFDRWRNAQKAVRITTMDDEDALERIDAAENAKKNMKISHARKSQQFFSLSEFMEVQKFFVVDRLGIGALEKKHCTLEVSIAEEAFYIYVADDLNTAPNVGNVVLPWTAIREVRYAVDRQIATFRLDSQCGRELKDNLENLTRSGGLARDIQTSRTAEQNSVSLLRVLFADTETKNDKKDLEDRLKLVGWDGISQKPSDAFATSVFPNIFKNAGRASQERSLFEGSIRSRGTLGQPHKALSKSVTSNTYASVAEEGPTERGDPYGSLFSLADLPPKHQVSQAKRTNPKVGGNKNGLSQMNGSSKRAKATSARDVPTTSRDDAVMVDLDDTENLARADSLLATNRSHNSSLTSGSMKAAPASHALNRHALETETRAKTYTCPSNPNIQIVVFPKMRSVLEEWEYQKDLKKQAAKAEELSKRSVSRCSQRTFAKANDTAASTSTSNAEDYIVLLDSDNEEEERHMDKQETKLNNTNLNTEVDLPDDCHPAFRSVPIFKEVILGNSSIMAGDIYQLATGQQLGDGIIQFMIEFVRLRLGKDDDKSFHLFSYYFFQTYLGAIRDLDGLKMKELPEKVRSRLREHTRKIEIFSKECLVVPILNEQHWYLAVICRPGACLVPKNAPKDTKNSQKTLMILFDSLHSLGSGDRHKFTFNLLQRWLEAEANQAIFSIPDYAECQLETSKFSRLVPKSPQQQNGVDCGVFMINALTHMVHHKPVFPIVNHNRITKPDMDTWFPNDAVATDSMRLHMLHCYLIVASTKQMFVYRDDLIPGMIKELGKEPEPLIIFPTETIQVDSSPAPKPVAKRQVDGDFKDMETVCAPRESRGPTTVMFDTSIPNNDTELQEMFELLGMTPFTPRPDRLTPKQLEFFQCSGYPLPKELPGLRGEIKATVDERKQRLAEWKEGRQTTKESAGLVRKSANEIYKEFRDGKGAVSEE